MTLVVKLGSSIVAADDGELRADVLDSVCAQVSALERGGERVVMVTSGAIARGMRLMELPVRPRAMDELQAASAVGQGDLFRAYESRLASGGTRAAQVLLTAADIAARTNYLNARQTLRRLVEWGVVPVINENDTTATDEISFGDNDFLAAQVALLLDARLLVLLTNVDGLLTADPRLDPEAELIAEVDDFAELAALEIGDRTSAFGSGGMRSKVAAAEMASEAGHPGGDLQRDQRRDAAGRGRGGEPVGTRFAAQAGKASSFKLWLKYAKPARGPARRRRRRRPGPARERLQPAAGRDRRGRGRASRPATRSRSPSTARSIGKGISRLLLPRAGAGDRDEERRRCASCCPHAADEVIHRDRFVLL